MDSCGGAIVVAGVGKGRSKYHKTPIEIHRCFARYMKAQGYEQLSRREYLSPNGGPIILISKKPGTPVVSGKSKERAGSGAGRAMGKQHTVKAW